VNAEVPEDNNPLVVKDFIEDVDRGKSGEGRRLVDPYFPAGEAGMSLSY